VSFIYRGNIIKLLAYAIIKLIHITNIGTKIERVMESEKSILEILQKLDTPISAHELWQQSIHHADIEKFYAELKTIQCKIEEIREGKNTKIYLKP
jgi:hypothetical protein